MKNSIYFLVLIIASFTYGCKEEVNPDQAAYDAADVLDGGRLFDQFWAQETSFNGPVDPNTNMSNVTNFPDFYRCKQCHGWDLKGTKGSYIGRKPSKTRPNVSVPIEDYVKTKPIRDIFDAIKNTGGGAIDLIRTSDGINTTLGGDLHPDYGKVLSDNQIWNLVKFLKEDAIDVDNLYDAVTTGSYPSGTINYNNWGKNGDASNGLKLYTQTCGISSCHGATGTGPVLADGITVGKFIRTKPYEAHHKIRYGQLGSVMTGWHELTEKEIQDIYKALSDITKFPD